MCDVCGKHSKNEVNVPMEWGNMRVCGNCVREMAISQLFMVDDFENDEVDTINNKEIGINNIKLITPKEIKEKLDNHVIGQELAKKNLSVGIYNHYKRIINNRFDIQKSNILMVGPTGVGKTELARTCAKILDVPFAIADATTLTEAGYVGDDVENILLKLIQAADGDISKAEKGIIYIDEIDKIARKGENVSITRDVSGEGVQQALLKIIEGTVSSVPVRGGRKHPQGDRVEIDTSNILFICGGAFEDVTMNNKEKKKHLGFGSMLEEVNDYKDEKVDTKKLIKAGIIPELIGRLPIIVKLNELEENDLKRILTEPENSIVKQYKDMFDIDNVSLKFTDSALQYIAHQAYENKTGARGLKSIIEDKMLDLMFEAPDGNFNKIIIDAKDNEFIIKKLKGKEKVA